MKFSTGAPFLFLFLLPALAAQTQTKVEPSGMEFVEGSSLATYPFGRTSGAIQLLLDASRVTASSAGVVTGIRFRQDDITPSQTHAGYTKNYKVTAYTVATSAQGMVADLATNVGGATGIVVFQGPLVVPPVQVLSVRPAPFDLAIPFVVPYPFDGTQGNLLFVVETGDMTPVPSGYRIDAVNFPNGQPNGRTSSIDPQGCVAGGASLALSSSPSTVVVGGSLVQTFTSSTAGAFPYVFGAVGFERQAVDLASLGMPGCTSWPLAPILRLVLENPGGGYPQLTWTLPNTASIEGVGLVGQGFGVAASGLLADSVTSNGIGARVGGASGPTIDMGMAFRTSTGSWYRGNNGLYCAVVQIEGVFP